MTWYFPLNFYLGWAMVLAAFVTGAAIGIHFHKEQFWGGYDSFRRRIARLGHIALAALGLMNVVFAVSASGPSPLLRAASICFIAGGLIMPTVCFLSAWRMGWRHLFFLPVLLLVSAVLLVLIGASQP